LIKLENLKNPLLVKKRENLFYLTGRDLNNHAEEFLLITPKNSVAFGYGLEKIEWFKKVDRLKNIGKYLNGYKNLDIEYGFTYGEGEYLSSKLSSLKLKVRPQRCPVDIIRQIKTAEEINLVRKSMQIVEKVFLETKKQLMNTDKKRINTEILLAKFIEKRGLELGAHDLSFPAIVASGLNAAIPHHVPGNKKLIAGEPIIIDFGFKYKNYCSDFTRTVFLKKVGSKKIEEVYNQVEKAYNGSIDFINQHLSLRVQPKQSNYSNRLPRPSGALGARNDKFVTGNNIYQKAVEILAEKKLDKYFIHSLGHGTGLEIHELPNLSPNSKDIMKNGMVFSIEPGVYISKLGGVRIEDLVYLPADSFSPYRATVGKKSTFDINRKSGYNTKKNLAGEELGKVTKFINVSTKLADNIF
jgi:Xaa-Pro aminopeptidase